jgi:hypothetical protein
VGKIRREKAMLNITTEKGIIIGESPHMILTTIESLDTSSSEIHQEFLVDERSESGILFIVPTGD